MNGNAAEYQQNPAKIRPGESADWGGYGITELSNYGIMLASWRKPGMP
jgi:hypothetical protein